ncbi:hypothetical protein [Microbulbifer epialgicus]|uniref:DUF2812 domain-containing protein n=1 Tax=Microbulbifer epialgicus TaxID=393907 RepID=A0ABV4NUK9_9GAMM
MSKSLINIFYDFKYARSLIDGFYDFYLIRSGKGILYEVPIVIESGNTTEECNITVWAASENEAEERAIAYAHSIQIKKSEKIQDRTLGLILPLSYYKPKGFKRTLTSPIAFWRDPVYKKGYANMFGAIGYRFGMMTKLSISDLKKNVLSSNQETEVSLKSVTSALKVNIVSIFIWASLLIMGVLFLFLGIHPGYKDKFVISWLNPYLVSSVVCFTVGFIAEYKTMKDYKWLISKLDELKKRKED